MYCRTTVSDVGSRVFEPTGWSVLICPLSEDKLRATDDTVQKIRLTHALPTEPVHYDPSPRCQRMTVHECSECATLNDTFVTTDHCRRCDVAWDEPST